MAIFTAIATAVTAITGSAIFGAVASFAARTLLTIGITKLVANRANKTAAGTQDSGARVQLPPATDNKVPVVYGKAYIAPIITDAKISTDQKYMWYVCTLAEVTDTGSYTFGDIYYNGKKVVFGNLGDTGRVTSMETNSDPIQIDDKVNGKIYIWRFPNGSSSGIDTGASNAITIMSDSSTGGGIPANDRWNGPIYTAGGDSAQMSNLAFMIVRVEYNQDAGTTGLGTLNVELTNSLDEPGNVLLDYMQNTRYGCAIPTTSIDTASLTTLNTYSAELITFTPVGGGSSTQPRYLINGPINTGVNCLDNLQQIVDACDSWLQYSELTGKWKVVINKPWDWVPSGPAPTLADLYQVSNYNLIGGININPLDLNGTYNKLEVQYPNKNIQDQTDFRVIDLIDYVPEVISENEPINTLTVQYPQVNNYIQSLYLGIRRLLQSREDLVIDFTLDYSGIQVEAGDVILVQAEQYGWETFNSGYGKFFRVSQVQEAKLDDGSLGARITAFEYNDLVYVDNALQDFVPEANTGLTDPNIISQPTAPVITTGVVANAATKYFTVCSNVPATGTVLYMDFNYGTNSNTQQHVRYSTVSAGTGNPFTANSQICVQVADLPTGNYYWSATGRNDSAGRTSNSSAVYNWGGPAVTDWNSNTNVGGVGYNQLGPTSGAVQTLQVYTYEVADYPGGILTYPVDLTTFPTTIKTANFDTPKYLDGTNILANLIYPFLQGTSSTLDGYLANSTAPLTPLGADQLQIYNGDDNWWVLEYKTLGSTVTPQEQINITGEFQLVNTGTPVTTIQLSSFATLSSNSQLILTQGENFATYTLYENEPVYIVYDTSLFGASIIDGGGILIRNLDANSTVAAIFGGLRLSKSKRQS